MWNSDITPWCAGKMGPNRDLTGELAAAVRKQNLIFGLSSHRMEHHTFAYPSPGVPNDEFDPRYAGFYGPPIPGEMNDGNASQVFQEDWLARVQELVDKYQPQLIYFDNGVNPRAYDDVKLRAAAYYFNRAAQWGKQVTFATKDGPTSPAPCRTSKSSSAPPSGSTPTPGSPTTPSAAPGATPNPHARCPSAPPASVITELIEHRQHSAATSCSTSRPRATAPSPTTSRKSSSPSASGSSSNGEAIYGSSPWIRFGEGPLIPPEAPGDWKGGSTDQPGPSIKREVLPAPSTADFRFTVAGDALYVFGYKWPSAPATIASLADRRAKVQQVTLLGHETPLAFRQTAEALLVTFPPRPPIANMPYTLRIRGSMPLSS